MVKFVESDSTGLPLKRKQVAQACISCRKRKKRCIHEGLAAAAAQDNGPIQDSVSPTKPGHRTFSTGDSTSRFTPSDGRPQHPSPSQESRAATRFIGDLNPQHLFIEATSPYSNRDLSVRGGIGIWQSKGPRDVNESTAAATRCPGPSQTMHDILIAHVRSNCLPCVPPTADWHALQDIYFDKLDPLYPVVSRTAAENGEQSASAVVLKQVICLAAATSPDALPHLRLMPYSTLLSRSDFTASLAAAIHVTIDSGLVSDRVLLIRILLLYAMYMQPTCPEEADLPTLIFSRAVHQLVTLGLHLPISDSDDDFDQIETLFCCTWALDRLNAAFYGRACIIHDRDIGWDLDGCIQNQSPPFRLFLMVTRLLDSVIGLYRPSQKLTEEPLFIDMPIMEQMIIDADATRVASALLATVEVFYHAVAILSCRFPQGGGGSDQSALPSRATNSRRSLSADRITELYSVEFPGVLSYVPTIPYAVSLSLSVGYRKMRYSQIPMFRSRGKRAFATNTALLKELGETFWCARTMAGMAEQVLQEMDKAAASIAQETSENSGREESDSQGDVIPAETPKPITRGVPMPSMTLEQGGGEIPIFPSAPEVDVWGHFDPNFNLGAVDAALQANLDFGASSNWFDWQQSLRFVE